MSYFFFVAIIAISFGIFITTYESSFVMGSLATIIFFMIGCLLFPAFGKTINMEYIKDSLIVVVSKGAEATNLDEEIERIIRDEVDDRFFDVVVDIQDSNVDKLDIKRINIKAKTPVITKYINIKYEYSFKIFIDKSNMEEFDESSIKIVGI